MFGNGQIFISHTHQDNQRCQPLLAALDAWQTDYWFDLQELDAGQRFSDRIQQAVEQRDIFVRVSTLAAERSFWAERELRAVRGLRAAFPGRPRLIVHVVLDAEVVGKLASPSGVGEVVIDASTGPRAQWMHELRQAMGAVTSRRVSRRTAIAAGAASVVAVATAAVAAKLFLTPSPAAVYPFHPKARALPAPIEPGELPMRWHYSLDLSAPEEGDSADNQVGLIADNTAVYALSPSSQVIEALAPKDSSFLWGYPDQSHVPLMTLNGHSIATTGSSSVLFILSELDTVGGNPFSAQPFYLIALEKATGKVSWMSPNLLLGGASANDWSELCLAGSSIYFQLNGKLYGYTQGGQALWPPLTMFVEGSNQQSTYTTSAPAYADGLVFVGTYDGSLLAVEAASGLISWATQLTTGQYGQVQASPSAAGGLVYVGASDGYCYALNASSGSLAWKTQLVNLTSYNINSFTDYSAFMGAATVSNGVVYLQAGVDNPDVGLTDNVLFALDAKSGKQLWKTDPTKLALPLLKDISGVTSTPGATPWYPTGNLIYATLGFISSSANYDTDLIGAQALLALNQQDGSLHSYYVAQVNGEVLLSGYFPSAPAPVPGGMAFMTNEPEIYVLDV